MTPPPPSTSSEAAAPTATAAGVAIRVLIADKFERAGISALEELGAEIRSTPDLTPDTLPAAVAEFAPDVLIVRSTKVPAPVFDAATQMSLVIRAGAGYDNIDAAAASSQGIFVANCPGKNAIAVAELTWGLILGCDRRLPDQTADLRSGRWDKKGYGQARGIYGRTIGIIGLGRIGQEIATRARAFGMQVIAWSRSLTQDKADELGVGYCSSLINLAKMADVVSVNVAATPETSHLIAEPFFQAMKEGAIFVNTSRGSVVDTEALIAGVREKGLRAGLDVFGEQPGPSEKEFKDVVIKEPCVYGSHHCGASTDQAQQAIASEVVRIIRTYRETGQVLHCVNRAASTPATTLLTVRHLNRPGVLAHVFYTLGQAGINVEEMENIIYEGYAAACARIQLDAKPNEEHLNAISANDCVLSIDVTGIVK